MKYRYYMELFYSLYIHVNLPQEGLKRITLIMTTLKKFYCNLKVNNLYNYTFTYTYQYIQHRVFNRDNLKPDIQKKEKQKKTTHQKRREAKTFVFGNWPNFSRHRQRGTCQKKKHLEALKIRKNRREEYYPC